MKTDNTPIIVTDYRARCCGTCKHNNQPWGECSIECKLGADPFDQFSICATHYEPEE